MTHLLDSSASLAGGFGEPGVERVRALLNDPDAAVGVSVLTLFETYTRVLHLAGSHAAAREAVAGLRKIVNEVVPLNEEIVDLAIELRHAATARIATVDCLIAATAVYGGAVLVHRDPTSPPCLSGGLRKRRFLTKLRSGMGAGRCLCGHNPCSFRTRVIPYPRRVFA